MEIPQEDLQGNSLSTGWPLEGSIEFKNVTLRYTPMSPAALQNVSFHVPAGSQVRENVNLAGKLGIYQFYVFFCSIN